MAIYNEEVNEIYPIQTFLKEEMLKNSDLLKELDKSKNKDSASISAIILTHSLMQALRSQAKFNAFKKYFAKYNKRVASIQHSVTQESRNQESTDIKEELLEDIELSNKETEERIEEEIIEQQENKVPEPIEPVVLSAEEIALLIETIYSAFDELLLDQVLADKDKEAQFKKLVGADDDGYNTYLMTTTDKEVMGLNQFIKHRYNTGKQKLLNRMRELRNQPAPVQKPEFVAKKQHLEQNIKEALDTVQENLRLLKMFDQEDKKVYEKFAKYFKQNFQDSTKSFSEQFSIDNFSGNKLDTLCKKIYELEAAVKTSLEPSYEKVNKEAREIEKKFQNDKFVLKPSPGFKVETIDSNNKVIMPDNNYSKPISSTQIYINCLNVLFAIQQMSQQIFSYNQTNNNTLNNINTETDTTTASASTAPIPTPKPWKEEL